MRCEPTVGKSKIRVAAHLAESETNGPGLRSVLWVQGCPKRCPGCWNPSFLNETGGTDWTIDKALEALTRSSRIEGVTFLGGEPFSQAESLSRLAFLLKSKGLSLMAYSGFTLEELRSQGAAQRELLSQCDILVDGEFIRNQSGPYLWRGSKNQKIHFLTERYKSWECRSDEVYRDFELFFEESRLVLTGDPPDYMVGAVKALVTSGNTANSQNQGGEACHG